MAGAGHLSGVTAHEPPPVDHLDVGVVSRRFSSGRRGFWVDPVPV